MSQRKELIGQEYPKERKNPRQKLADTVSCPTALVAIVTFLPPFCCSDKFLTIFKNTILRIFFVVGKIHFQEIHFCPTALVAIVTFLSPSCCSDKFPPISENTLVKHILSINTV